MANVLIIKELICKYFASCVHLIIPLILTFRFLIFDIRKRNLQLLMIILCGTKVLTSFDKKEGDGRIPYPFFDFYHQSWYFCFFIILSILVFGFGISVLFDYLNKKCEKLIFQFEPKEKEGENGLMKDNQQIFVESTALLKNNKNIKI